MNKKIVIIGMALFAAVALVVTAEAVFRSTRYVSGTLAPNGQPGNLHGYSTSPYALAVFVSLDDTDPYVGLCIGYIEGEVFYWWYKNPGDPSIEIPPGTKAGYGNPWSFYVDYGGHITSYWW